MLAITGSGSRWNSGRTITRASGHRDSTAARRWQALHQADVGGPVFATIGGVEKLVGVVIEGSGVLGALVGDEARVRRLDTLSDADQAVIREDQVSAGP